MMCHMEDGHHASAIEYLDSVASSTAGSIFKRELLNVLRLQPGQTVLDVGCGVGSDLAGIQALVAPSGFVIGVDNNPAMCAEARRRFAGALDITVCRGDAQALPLANASVDRARAERVLMHVGEPQQVLAELRRVIRPDGIVTLAEPDWGSLIIDHPDQALSRAFTQFASTEIVRHGSIGRQLVRLANSAGFNIIFATARTVIHRDFDSAQKVWRLDMATDAAITRGHLDESAGREWLRYLRQGAFFGSITFFIVAIRPATSPHPRGD